MIQFSFKPSLYSSEAVLAAVAGTAARSAWVEINRPLTAMALNADITKQIESPTKPGEVLQLPTVSFSIGMDVKSITCIVSDIDVGWQVVNFTLGTLNLVNPQGTIYGVNLSMFDPRLAHEDKIAPWILSKTKVDVQVTANLLNGAFYTKTDADPRGQKAIFHGFSINAFQEEQVCAIVTRIERTDRNVGCVELLGLLRGALQPTTTFTAGGVANALERKLVRWLSESGCASPQSRANPSPYPFGSGSVL